MKKFKLFALIAAVMVITLLSVTGAWAGPAQLDTEVTSTVDGEGQEGIPVEDLVPPGQGLQNFAGASRVGVGEVCFTVPWDVQIHNPTIRVLDNGHWVSGGLTTTMTPTDAGFQYCVTGGTGTYALQGY